MYFTFDPHTNAMLVIGLCLQFAKHRLFRTKQIDSFVSSKSLQIETLSALPPCHHHPYIIVQGCSDMDMDRDSPKIAGDLHVQFKHTFRNRSQ